MIGKYLLQRYVGCGVFNFQHLKSICNYLVVTNLKRMNNFLNLKPGNIYLRNLKPKCQIDSDIHRKNSRIYSLWIYPITYAAFDAKYIPGYRFGKEKLVNQNQTGNFYCIFQNIYKKNNTH